MSVLPEGITAEQLDRIAVLNAAMLAYKEELDLLKDQAKAAFKAAGYTGSKTLTYDSPRYGNGVVKLGEQRRVDDKKLIADHPVEAFPEYWTGFNKAVVPVEVLDTYREITMTLSVTGESAPTASPRRAQV